ncbi:MAG: hypothetical protein V1887_02775 [Candidatus Aenigmatarchaeota archaeon]
MFERPIDGNGMSMTPVGYKYMEPGCYMKDYGFSGRSGNDIPGPAMIVTEPLYHADWFQMAAKDAQAAMDHYNAKAAIEDAYHRKTDAWWQAQTDQGALEGMMEEIAQMHERARWRDMNRQIGRLLVENSDMKITDAFREALQVSNIEDKYPEDEPVTIYFPHESQPEEVSYDTFVQSIVIPVEHSLLLALRGRKVYDRSRTEYTKNLGWGEIFGTEGEHFHITVPNPPTIQELITHNRETWGRIHGTWDVVKAQRALGINREHSFGPVSGTLEATIVVDSLKKMGSLERRVEISSVKLDDYKTPWGTYDLQKMVSDCGVDLRKLRKK